MKGQVFDILERRNQSSGVDLHPNNSGVTMTGEQKKNIFFLLKAASSCALGYGAKNFSVMPSFSDDPEFQTKESVGSKLEDIAKRIENCTDCPLSAHRNNAVAGEGVTEPLVLVVGEGPGEDEDKTGRPFVGKAGQLLDKMLASIGLDRTKNCYIANIVKCRPPENRTPMPSEAAACSPYLQAQIHILKPKLILAMGRTAFQNLMQSDEGINSARGKFYTLSGIPLMPTYHPSALLRNEELKRPAWQDLKAFKARLVELCPDYEK